MGQDFWQKLSIFLVWDLKANKQKETYFATRKILQNFEGQNHCHCRHKFLSHLQFFKVGEIMVSKYWHLMLHGGFPDKVIPNIDFTDEAVLQCYVLVVKILLYVLVIYHWSHWCEYLWRTCVLFCGPSFVYCYSFLKSWILHDLRGWLHKKELPC